MGKRGRRMLLWSTAIAAACYLAACALLYSQQRRLIYYPQLTRVEPAQTDIALPRPGATLRGWVVNPGRRDAVLYFGGNAESVQASRDDLARWLPGHTAYLFAYRGYGASDGVPSEAALLADALAQFDDVARRHPDGQVSVVGRSLGSGVATHVAAERTVPRLVLVTPFDSLAAVAQSHYPVFPARWLLHDHYDSSQRLPRHRGELLVLRAGRDVVVPPANTDRLLKAFKGRALIVDFPHAGHDDLSLDPHYWRTFSDFLETGAD
ncbi:alpha/beta fold hydrolase [Pseudoxanthomonas sp. PXM03]|uniref:alpha/beta hydrolase n=1 Tax=Pseudoxanthomonas sp. PXM03 TaxID=2769284 RepID=UPI001CE0BB2D|nr:alpha/beta fold hydrolase [Pseudoxanthomonas sp. PXM03]